MSTTAIPQTLFHKLWPRHLVEQSGDGEALLYVDRHRVYEVTSPQAFEGLRIAGRKPWRRETVIATVDHNVPTLPAERAGIDAIADPLSRLQHPVRHHELAAGHHPRHRPRTGRDAVGHDGGGRRSHTPARTARLRR